ncbi:MAG TPA: lysophospholipid acyltransferase family protein [Dermatophilaceae bacterium]|nr:lysophospholipid acyltransferase family protein [Dermatophilaceae bacterium]
MSARTYRVGWTLAVPLARALWQPTVTGTEHIPRTGGVLLASNHLSFIDSFAIPMAAPRRVSFLAKSDYFAGTGAAARVRRAVFEAIDAIPVDRESSRAAQESLDAALAVLREGRAFGIYPEGTRSRDGRLYRGRTGVAWLALTAGVPVVPVGLRGTDAVQPIGARFPKREHVSVAFGAPVRPEPYADLPAGRARRHLTDAVMDAIAGLSGQERADSYNELPAGSSGAAVGI